MEYQKVYGFVGFLGLKGFFGFRVLGFQDFRV
jgi:hypothetical protein